MTVGPSGSIMCREEKLDWRQKLGYCTTCTERPVLLFKMKRSRLNPLWKSKEPRTVPGECENGVCFRCHRPQQGQSIVLTARVAPATNHSNMTGNRQPSNSTLESSTQEFFSRSNSTDSIRFSQQQQQQHELPRHSRASARRHSSHHREDVTPLRSMSNDDITGMGTFHSSALGTNASSSQHSNRHHHGNVPPRLPRTDRAALLPRSHESHHHHHQPTTIDELNQSASSLTGANLTVPALISPMKRPTSFRQYSSSNFSVASSLSNDFSVPSLGDESMSDLNLTTTQECHPSTIVAAAATTANATTNGTTEEDKVKHQVRALVRDLQSNPAMMGDVLLNAMKSNAEKEGVQLFCLGLILNNVPIQAVTSSVRIFVRTQGAFFVVLRFFVSYFHSLSLSLFIQQGLYRVVLQAMKNHRQSIKVQQAGLNLLVEWTENDNLRLDLIRHGLCDHVAPLLSMHVGDAIAVQDVVAVLRLVTLEQEGRALCQRVHTSQLVVQGMQCHATQGRIQTDGCAVLSNLALDMDLKSVVVVSSVVLDAVVAALVGQAALLERGRSDADWAVIKSACFTIKNLLYREENRRTLASRDDLLQGLETVVQKKPRGSKDAVVVFEKLQLSRVQDESLQAQVLEALQMLWYKPVPKAVDEILSVWKEHAWSARILISSLHQIQDMLQSQDYTDPNELDRIMIASKALAGHADKRVAKEVEVLQAFLVTED